VFDILGESKSELMRRVDGQDHGLRERGFGNLGYAARVNHVGNEVGGGAHD
jgi:hypothetical protein